MVIPTAEKGKRQRRKIKTRVVDMHELTAAE
jgi:hypothetical protein